MNIYESETHKYRISKEVRADGVIWYNVETKKKSYWLDFFNQWSLSEKHSSFENAKEKMNWHIQSDNEIYLKYKIISKTIL